MEKLIEALKTSPCTVAMTGAGVSTLCGIPDFRGPQGLYKQPDAERIFDIDWFDRDPSIYYRGARELVYGLRKFQPGPVHLALKHLEDMGKLAGIVTQNIDMLHQKAGSSNVWEVHGSGVYHHCRRCGDEKTFEQICAMLDAGAEVPRCACGGPYKPDITFFGEMLPEKPPPHAPGGREGVHRQRTAHAARRLRGRPLRRPPDVRGRRPRDVTECGIILPCTDCLFQKS